MAEFNQSQQRHYDYLINKKDTKGLTPIESSYLNKYENEKKILEWSNWDPSKRETKEVVEQSTPLPKSRPQSMQIADILQQATSDEPQSNITLGTGEINQPPTPQFPEADALSDTVNVEQAILKRRAKELGVQLPAADAISNTANQEVLSAPYSYDQRRLSGEGTIPTYPEADTLNKSLNPTGIEYRTQTPDADTIATSPNLEVLTPAIRGGQDAVRLSGEGNKPMMPEDESNVAMIEESNKPVENEWKTINGIKVRAVNQPTGETLTSAKPFEEDYNWTADPNIDDTPAIPEGVTNEELGYGPIRGTEPEKPQTWGEWLKSKEKAAVGGAMLMVPEIMDLATYGLSKIPGYGMEPTQWAEKVQSEMTPEAKKAMEENPWTKFVGGMAVPLTGFAGRMGTTTRSMQQADEFKRLVKNEAYDEAEALKLSKGAKKQLEDEITDMEKGAKTSTEVFNARNMRIMLDANKGAVEAPKGLIKRFTDDFKKDFGLKDFKGGEQIAQEIRSGVRDLAEGKWLKGSAKYILEQGRILGKWAPLAQGAGKGVAIAGDIAKGMVQVGAKEYLKRQTAQAGADLTKLLTSTGKNITQSAMAFGSFFKDVKSLPAKTYEAVGLKKAIEYTTKAMSSKPVSTESYNAAKKYADDYLIKNDFLLKPETGPTKLNAVILDTKTKIKSINNPDLLKAKGITKIKGGKAHARMIVDQIEAGNPSFVPGGEKNLDIINGIRSPQTLFGITDKGLKAKAMESMLITMGQTPTRVVAKAYQPIKILESAVEGGKFTATVTSGTKDGLTYKVTNTLNDIGEVVSTCNCTDFAGGLDKEGERFMGRRSIGFGSKIIPFAWCKHITATLMKGK